jgi:hypothetical protein
MQKLSKPTTIVLLAVLSTPVSAQTQTIQINTVCADGTAVVGAMCTLSLGETKTSLLTPGTASVPKSSDDLLVSCVKGSASAEGQFSSRKNGGTWGKLAAWGGMDQIMNWKDLDQLHYPKEMTVVLAGDCAK